MAVIKSGASSDNLTIDATSKAARVSLYDSNGVYRGIKRTYRGSSTSFAAAAGTAPFFLMEGSASTTARLQRVIISGFTLTAVQYLTVNLAKYSTAGSGGTSANITQVPVDSGFAAATLNTLKQFTAAPTPGSLVGLIASKLVLGQATTAAAGGLPQEIVFDFTNMNEADKPTLRGTSQGFGLLFGSAPASAVTLNITVEWTEE